MATNSSLDGAIKSGTVICSGTFAAVACLLLNNIAANKTRKEASSCLVILTCLTLRKLSVLVGSSYS